MRNYEFTPDHHQIIHANSCPLPPSSPLSFLPDPRFRSNFPTSIEEDPDIVSLFHFTHAARYISAIVENERYEYGCLPDGGLGQEVFFSERFSCCDVSC